MSNSYHLPSEGIGARLAVLGKGIETGNLSCGQYDEMAMELSKEDTSRVTHKSDE